MSVIEKPDGTVLPRYGAEELTCCEVSRRAEKAKSARKPRVNDKR